eukprot:TRINITY_DN14715_c0_g1_i1.p1 TRINITY_DN14715_c0_g1~~TRINITY_DN14715_c0_g1_i1.p1  ORF type:complete len:364 (-),score=38.18 TRINITY_DN14715_c0_g1_i1:201-1292(-)
MCIRDRYQRRVRGLRVSSLMRDRSRSVPSSGSDRKRSFDVRKFCNVSKSYLCTRTAIILLIFTSITLIFLWWRAVLAWGTISPIIVWSYTSAFHGEYIGYPPAGWKPKSRVVVSLTTLPHHLHKLQPTLDSLLKQTVKPDAIYLNLPSVPNPRTGQIYDLDFAAPDGITILRPYKDYGPLTKLFPAILQEQDPETIIITVDDDQLYSADMVNYLTWYAEHFPDTAFGLCGWSFLWVARPLGVTPIYIPFLLRPPTGRKVEVLQACCGNLYRRKFFQHPEQLEDVPKNCFTTDDLWIAGFLATQTNVSRVVIPPRQDTSPPDWKSSDTEGFKWRLSNINTKGMMDIKCIDAIEDKFGMKWPIDR